MSDKPLSVDSKKKSSADFVDSRKEGPGKGKAKQVEQDNSRLTAKPVHDKVKSGDQDSRKEGRGERNKPEPIGSLDQLIRSVYDGKFKRKVLNEEEILNITVASSLDGVSEELHSLSVEDVSLEKTKNLMVLSMRFLDLNSVVPQLHAFIRDVLESHPVFSTELMQELFESGSGVRGEESAFRELADQSYANLVWPDGSNKLKAHATAQCRSNAICCLLIRLRQTRSISSAQVQRYLQTFLWDSALKSVKTDSEKIAALILAKDISAIATACEVYRQKAQASSNEANRANSLAEHAEKRIKNLKNEINSLNSDLLSSENKVDSLQKDLDESRREVKDALLAHKTSVEHSTDDYEKLRGQMIRRLKTEIELLDEGLHALRLNEPKIHVMDDHAERAIDGLKKELEQLKREG